jgi:hypothetical protein
MVGMIGVLAFAVDLGYVQVVRTEMQRTADAAALSAAKRLYTLYVEQTPGYPQTAEPQVSAVATTYAKDYNPVGGKGSDLASSDIQFLSYQAAPTINAVRVSVRRTADSNGEVPLFFGRIFGMNSSPQEGMAATAAFKPNYNIRGFPSPPPNRNLMILPLALDKPTWDAVLKGIGSDGWTWDSATKTVRPGGDGIYEVNLYPQDTGAPGNRGTVRIGHSNNSTAIISRQIREGLNQADLDYHGGELKLDANGELKLPGDPGISNGIKDDLAFIKGQPRIIPIYKGEVTGQGANAQYTIVEFGGVCITDVVLTGKMTMRRVMVQPTRTIAINAILAPPDAPVTSHYVFPTPGKAVWLVR